MYLLRYGKIPHEEYLIPCFHPDFKAEMVKLSPSGMVPALIDDELTVWDSLAIVEYLHEKFPNNGIWPSGTKERAMARSVASEIHSGAPKHLGSACSFNLGKIFKIPKVTTNIQSDINQMAEQIKSIQSQFGTEGRYLFGEFSAVDSFYAVSFSRIKTYSIEPPKSLKPYMDLLLGHPIFKELTNEAHTEGWVIEMAEEDYPVLEDFRAS